MDFSEDKQATEWVARGNAHFATGHTAMNPCGVSHPPVAAGAASGCTSENRTYLRWEDPVLGINGERRAGPIIPGCQQITTVIAPDVEVLGMIPASDVEHQKLVGTAMFIAANLQIFGPLVGILVVLLFVVVVRKKKDS